MRFTGPDETPKLSASERKEDLMQAMSDHSRGEHDWSCPDAYDCTVCHAMIDIYAEAVAREAMTPLSIKPSVWFRT